MKHAHQNANESEVSADQWSLWRLFECTEYKATSPLGKCLCVFSRLSVDALNFGTYSDMLLYQLHVQLN
jgi:hypothetical protein